MKLCRIKGCALPVVHGQRRCKPHIARASRARVAERRARGERMSGVNDAARVVYDDGTGPRFGSVPEHRRCRGCRGWATHRLRTSMRSGKKSRGWLACLGCIALWARYGVRGRVEPIAEAA